MAPITTTSPQTTDSDESHESKSCASKKRTRSGRIIKNDRELQEEMARNSIRINNNPQLLPTYYRQQKLEASKKYISEAEEELRVGVRPDIGAWKPLVNATLGFADPNRAITVNCSVCNTIKCITDTFCWSSKCPVSPIYEKLDFASSNSSNKRQSISILEINPTDSFIPTGKDDVDSIKTSSTSNALTPVYTPLTKSSSSGSLLDNTNVFLDSKTSATLSRHHRAGSDDSTTSSNTYDSIVPLASRYLSDSPITDDDVIVSFQPVNKSGRQGQNTKHHVWGNHTTKTEQRKRNNSRKYNVQM